MNISCTEIIRFAETETGTHDHKISRRPIELQGPRDDLSNTGPLAKRARIVISLLQFMNITHITQNYTTPVTQTVNLADFPKVNFNLNGITLIKGLIKLIIEITKKNNKQ